MATGVTPFRGETSGVIFDAILNRAPAGPVRLNPELPAKLEDIINKALEKDIALRYQHASELMADLKRLVRDTNSGMVAIPAQPEAPSARTKAVPLPLPEPPRSRRTVWTVLAAVVAIALVGFGFWSGRLMGFRSSKATPVASVAAPPPVMNSPPPVAKPSPSSPAPASSETSHPAILAATAKSRSRFIIPATYPLPFR